MAIGLTSIYYGILNYNQKQNISKNATKNTIDIPLPLLFSIVFIVFISNSINFASSNIMTSKFLYSISNIKQSIFYYYFYIIIYLICFTIFPIVTVSLATMIIDFSKKYIANLFKIGSIIMMLSGVMIILLF